jgi:hypothetical protein
VSEIPYGVQKSKLIEQVAALIAEKKLPILADVRDESDEQVRLILEPRARTVDPELLIESLCRLTDLEIRFPLNLNVLDENRTPGVMSLKEALVAWLKFQREVLVRKSQVRIGKIDERVPKRERLGQADERVVQREVSMRMVLAHHVADDARAFLVRAGWVEPEQPHPPQDPPMDRFQAVADVGQRPRRNGREGIDQVTFGKRRIERRIDGGGIRFGDHHALLAARPC